MRKSTNEKLTGLGSAMNEADVYRKKIIEEVRKMDNLWILQQIWAMIKNIKK